MAETVNLEQKKELVKKQAFFSQLSEKERDMLTSLFTEVHIPKDQIIVTKGDPVDSVFIIVSGTADVRNVYIKDNQIKSESLAQLGAETAIGLNETGFYSISGIRTATVVALTDMVVLRLSVAAFHGFALAYPRVNEILRKNTMNQVDKSA